MNQRIDPVPPRTDEPPSEPGISGAERAELQRQGAKASARGEPSGANPLSRARNQPPATGESADRWLQRSDAWDHGHEMHAVTRRKEGLGATDGDGEQIHDLEPQGRPGP